MSLLDDFQRDISNQQSQRPSHPRLFRNASDAISFIQESGQQQPTATIALSMYIAFRQPFHSGWVLWLGNEEAACFTVEQREQLPSTSFDFKATHFFRLSLWTNNARRRGVEYVDVTTVPDGTEVYIARVTGLQLFEMSGSELVLAQGNARRLEVVPTIDVESEEDADAAAAAALDAEPAALALNAASTSPTPETGAATTSPTPETGDVPSTPPPPPTGDAAEPGTPTTTMHSPCDTATAKATVSADQGAYNPGSDAKTEATGPDPATPTTKTPTKRSRASEKQLPELSPAANKNKKVEGVKKKKLA